MRGFVLAAALAAAVLGAGRAQARTEWDVHPSLGLDALAFVGALSGDKLQARLYDADIQAYRARMTPEERAAFDRLGTLGARMKAIIAPTLAKAFSVGPTDTLEDVLATADDPEGRLRPGLEKTSDWDARTWPIARQMVTEDVAPALRTLRRLGFEADWRTRWRPVLEADAARWRKALARYDVIAEDERLTGRRLDKTLELVLLHYNNPYGVRLTGQRFVSHHQRKLEDQLLIAAHEVFHPPYDRADAAVWRAVEPLRADPWMASIVKDHDPAYGYNSFSALFEEDSAQALDQIVTERLGLTGKVRGPGDRWRQADGGMHMLAAALYRAMKDDGFDRRGGAYADWLAQAAARGVLAPDNLRRLASEVAGQAAVDAWGPDRAAAGAASTP